MIARVLALLDQRSKRECASTAQVLFCTLASRFAVTKVTADHTTFVSLDGNLTRGEAKAWLL